MDSGFYAATTALISKTQALDAVANNLANVNTSGFRGEHNQFKSVLAKASATGSSPLNLAVNDYGVLGSTRLDLAQGSLHSTGNDLDMALQGSGFFVVQTANGNKYTRDGAFQVSSKGQLVTQQGDPVLGTNGPINVNGGKVSVGADGTVSVNGAAVTRLQLVDFPATTTIESQGGTYYSAPANEATASKATVAQGTLEGSNVNPVTSAVELITVQREAEMMQRTMSMFHNDLDKTATEELTRVS